MAVVMTDRPIPQVKRFGPEETWAQPVIDELNLGLAMNPDVVEVEN